MQLLLSKQVKLLASFPNLIIAEHDSNSISDSWEFDVVVDCDLHIALGSFEGGLREYHLATIVVGFASEKALWYSIAQVLWLVLSPVDLGALPKLPVNDISGLVLFKIVAEVSLGCWRETPSAVHLFAVAFLFA